MIRFLLYLIVFVTGLAAAAIWLAEMRHLRQAVDTLPIWTAPIAADARVPAGSATALGPNGVVTLDWKATAPTVKGLNWALTMSGDGIEARAKLTLPFWPSQAIVSDGKGTVSHAGQLIRVTAIEGQVPLLDRNNQPDGFVELTLAEPITLPAALAAFAEDDGTRIRLPIKMP